MHFMRVSTSLWGRSAVSDVVYLSPSRLATYADCARKYDHKYEQRVETPDETTLYLNQGLAYHETIEVVCNETEPDDEPEQIHARAMATFEETWADHIDPADYASQSHQEFQRAENRAALDTFFDPNGGDGIEHARSSVETERWVKFERNGRGLHGKVDNILKTEDELHLIDYKRNLRDVISSGTATRLEDHRNGDDHEPKRVKNAFQTATYIEGIKQSPLYEDGMTVRFSFYGLMNQGSFVSRPDGYEVSARGYPRETTGIYDEYNDMIWSLIEEAHDGITSDVYDPKPFDLINDEACPDCDYSDACAEYIAERVSR